MTDTQEPEESVELQKQHEAAKGNGRDTAVHAQSTGDVRDHEKTRQGSCHEQGHRAGQPGRSGSGHPTYQWSVVVS